MIKVQKNGEIYHVSVWAWLNLDKKYKEDTCVVLDPVSSEEIMEELVKLSDSCELNN